MSAVYWLFAVAAGIVLYAWAGYPLLVSTLAVLLPRPRIFPGPLEQPFVSVVVPVHNEEQRIGVKLGDCLNFGYPHDRLEIIVASDGSTDRTEEMVREFAARDARIRWLASTSRVGKSGVQNLAAAQARGDFLFFTDANTSVPTRVLRTMVDKLSDPKVGLVTATVAFGRAGDAIEKGQGFYWRYELGMRSAESDLGILATGSGQGLLVRRQLFRPLPTCYGDDCVLPLDVRLQGYRVVQDREAIVFDTMPHSIAGELRARIRMTARNWTGTLSRPALLNPLRLPLTALGLVSHKLLRWLTPVFLAIILLCNALTALRGHFIFLWWLQVMFYVSALVGWQLTRRDRPASVFGYAFSFCLANAGFLLGLTRAFRNQKIVSY